MEQKIHYVSLIKFHSNKSDKDFFQIQYVINHKGVTQFISEELYNKFSDKKLIELKEYVATFETNSRMGLELVDIK